MAKNLIKRIKTSLKLIPIKAYKEIDGWLTENEAMGLFEIARKLPKNCIAVEIGSWQGKSTFCIAKGIKQGKIYAVDPFDAGTGNSDFDNLKLYQQRGEGKNLLDVFLLNMKRLEVLSKIEVKKGYSVDFYRDFDRIDFLFIDGDHSIEGCRNDFDQYASKVVKGGFIAFHDYYQNRVELGPTYVVTHLVMDAGFQFYALYDSLWIGLKQ